MPHDIVRVRHETRRRRLTVAHAERITPCMLRVHLTGSDLDDFTSLGADDHVKLFVPGSGDPGERRDYTPRRFDARSRTLALDFAIHDGGPATQWALRARSGDTIEIGGPRGSQVVPHDFDWWLLAGDETALPAIGRRIEELPAGAKVTSLVSVTGRAEEQRFATQAEHRAIWIHRPLAQADDPTPLLAAMRDLEMSSGDGYIWIAAEASVARALRAHVRNDLAHPPAWTKAAGYWRKGQADVSEKFED